MMLKKEQKQRQSVEMLCTDMVVPKNHLLRKIDAAVNFDRIYEMVEPLYCKDNGRPSIEGIDLFVRGYKLGVLMTLEALPTWTICLDRQNRIHSPAAFAAGVFAI